MFRLFVSLLMVLLVCAAQADYAARLYFRDATTGDSGAGAVVAHPGDVVEVWFSFHKLDMVNPYKWGTLQVTLCFDGLNIAGKPDKDNWEASITAAKSEGGPASDFLATVIGKGELCDNVFFCHPFCYDGLYVLLGINGSKARAQDWDAKLWSFTVQPYSAGETLDWLLDGRDTGTGLSTRILDQKNNSVDVTDNRVTVVPEPAAVAGAIMCAAAVYSRRRR